MAVHAHRQGLDTCDRKKGVHGRERRAEIAQGHGTSLGSESEIAEALVELQAVIGGFGIGERGKAVSRRPVKMPGFHHYPAEGIAMAAEEFGSGMTDDV